MATPTLSEMSRVIAAETTRRRAGSLRLSRHVPTTSCPASTAARRRGISSGGFWRSASSVTTTVPRACAKPASTAACCPALRASATTVTRGSRRWIARSTPSDPSTLPSSTKITSELRSSASRTAARRAWSACRPAASLKAGITTDTAGTGAPGLGSTPTTPRRSGSMAPHDLAERAGDVEHVGAGHGREERERHDALRRLGRVREIPGRDAEPLAVEPVQVERLEMESDADVRVEELLHDGVPPEPELFEPQAHDEEVPRVPSRIGHGREHLDRRQGGEGLAVPAGDARPRREELLEAGELGEAERGLDVRQVVLEAERDDLVVGERALPVPAPRVAADAVEAEKAETVRERGIVRRHHAALAGRDRLDGVEAEDGGGGAAADGATTIPRAERVGRVLDQRDAAAGGDRLQGVQVERLTREVDGQDRARARRDRALDRVGQDLERPRIDVDEHRARADGEDHVTGRGPRHRGRDDVVAATDPGGEECEVEAGRRRADRDRVTG